MLSMSMLEISSVVILYNSQISGSETLQSLLNCKLDENINLTVNIWNNGPSKLSESDVKAYFECAQGRNIRLNIYEDCRNPALSKIYNFFIEKKDYDFIVLLDQDSQLEADFYNNIVYHKDYDLVCPAVFIKTDEQYQECPIFQKNYTKCTSSFLVGEIVTISSGLALSKNLIKQVESKFDTVFNENYAFYEIDIEFFKARLNNIGPAKGICVGRIQHDLNGKTDIKEMSPSIKLEVGYGRILDKLYIAKKSLSSVFIYTIKQIVKYQYGAKAAMSLLKCLFSKKHPRCIYNINAQVLPIYTLK